MSGTTVVIGCSRAKRSHLAPVVEVLAGRGNAVEVVSGLDETDEPWKDTVHRLGGAAVYVLCLDEAMNLRRVGQLRKYLSDARVAGSKVWCGPIDWNQPTQVLRNVEHLLEARVMPPNQLNQPLGPSETSGAVLPPPIAPMNPAATTLGTPTAGETFVSGTAWRTPRVKFAAILGGIGLLGLAAAVPLMSSDTDSEADQEVAVSALATAVDESAEVAVAGKDGDQEGPTVSAEVPELEPELIEPDDRNSVFRALASQRVRALDILLVGPESMRASKWKPKPAKLSWNDARAYCAGLEVEGVSGWRLPSAGELASLSKGNMLGKGVYWSVTKGDSFGNDRVVWSVRKKRMSPMGLERKARTICVRLQRPE